MAEVAIMPALGLLIQFITPQLIEKLNLQMDVVEENKNLQSWHSLLQDFMDENYGHQHSKTLVGVLYKVGETIFAIEDVVDEFNRLSLLHKFHANIVLRQIYRHGLSEKIESIKKDIETIKAQKSFASSTSTSMPITPDPLPKGNHEMVGYEDQKKLITSWLIRGEKRPVTVAVDGPAGSGKTALVANIFHEAIIQKKFDAYAIVSAQVDDGKSLLQKVSESMKVKAEDDLRGFLNGKSYLIVVDDVWGHDEWKILKDPFFFPDSSRRRSRIIVTTRSTDVSAICDHVITLQGLEPSDARKLFCLRAFPGQEECPSELHDVSNKIVAWCGGLPLAIVTVAGALAKKQRSQYEWERFHANLGSEIWSNSDLGAINSSLLRSYMDLSSKLKCCFLYMSIFPDDLPVERGRLIRLWVAERLAAATDSHTAEEVAENYLDQLIGRNLILVSNSDFHSLSNVILNFVVRKSKDENIATVYSQTQKTIEDQRRHRRLSFNDHCQLILPEEGDFDTVRSMFLFRSIEETDPSESEFEKKLRMPKLIKVLDVQGAKNLTKFPDKIIRRVLLRYLSFRDTNIESIPSSIHKLYHLETLDLTRTQVAEIPQDISNLNNLRHLLASKYDAAALDSVQGVELPQGISILTNLQTLSLVKVDPNGRVLKDLKALTQLKKLGLTHLRREHGKDLCKALESMKTLRTLDVTSASKEELIELEEMENQPRSLQRLYLKGRLEKIPAWISKLDGLVRIDLKWSGLKNSPLEALKRLRNLRELQLVDCFSGEELRFEGKGFEKLEIIVMKDFANLKRLKVRGGSAPGLKKISVRRCSQLRMPSRVRRLVEVESEEDINGGYFVDKWVDSARSFVPERINLSIDMTLRGINRRR